MNDAQVVALLAALIPTTPEDAAHRLELARKAAARAAHDAAYPPATSTNAHVGHVKAPTWFLTDAGREALRREQEALRTEGSPCD